MSERRWAGSWLSGTRAGQEGSSYPGQDLGLPETGPRSVAGVGRRIGALFIDWLLSMIIAVAAFHSQYWTIVVFGVEVYLLTALTGFTIGKRLLQHERSSQGGARTAGVAASVRPLAEDDGGHRHRA